MDAKMKTSLNSQLKDCSISAVLYVTVSFRSDNQNYRKLFVLKKVLIITPSHTLILVLIQIRYQRYRLYTIIRQTPLL